MDEFIKKLMDRLEESKAKFVFGIKGTSLLECMEVNAVSIIAHQLAEEYNNDFCEWEIYGNSKHAVTGHGQVKYTYEVEDWLVCPYCGKRIKVVE